MRRAPESPERGHQQATQLAIAGGLRLIRMLDGRVEGHGGHDGTLGTTSARARAGAAASERRAEELAEPVRPGVEIPAHGDARDAGDAHPMPEAGVLGQRLDRRRERASVPGRDEPAVDAVDDELGDRRRPRGDHGQSLGERLDHDVRQPVPVAIRGDLGGEHEEITGPVLRPDRGLVERAGPEHAIREAEGLGAGAERRFERPVSDDGEPDRAPDAGHGLQQGRVPLLRLEAAHRQEPHRVGRIAAVAWRADARRGREEPTVEAVIDELHPPWQERVESGPSGLRAGHGEARIAELGPELPVRGRPHVLRVPREAHAEPGHDRRVAGDGGRGVEEVGVDVRGRRGKLRRQHAGLAEAPAPVGCRVAEEVGEPAPECPEVAARRAREGLDVSPSERARAPRGGTPAGTSPPRGSSRGPGG